MHNERRCVLLADPRFVISPSRRKEMKPTQFDSKTCASLSRRSLLGTTAVAAAFSPGTLLSKQLGVPGASLSKEQRDRMSPADVLAELKNGNKRFRAGKMTTRDYLAEKRS